MRIALISDLHGNMLALGAVLDDIARLGADRVVCLGDIASLGPSPGPAVRRVRERGCVCVQGNHEAFLTEPSSMDQYELPAPIREANGWSRERLSADELAFLASFPPQVEVELGDGRAMLCCHGSPRSHMDNLLASTAGEELDAMLGDARPAVLACGHTHLPLLRRHRDLLIVNPGSVGLPFLEFTGGAPPVVRPYAEYALLEVEDGEIGVALRRLPLSREALAASVADSSSPLAGYLAQQYAVTGGAR